MNQDDKRTNLGGAANNQDEKGTREYQQIPGKRSVPRTVFELEGQIESVAWFVCINEEGRNAGKLFMVSKKLTHFGNGTYKQDYGVVQTNGNMKIDDDHVSEKHGALEMEDGVWHIQFYATTNPSLLNGSVQKNRVPIKNNDVIKIGKTRLVFKCLPGEKDHV